MCVFILTDICCALGNRKIGSSAPSSGLIIPLTAAAVGPSGVVLAFASQFLFVKDAAVGVKVALAPVVKKGKKWKYNIRPCVFSIAEFNYTREMGKNGTST